MMTFNLILAGTGLSILIYLGWRVSRFLKKSEEKFFHGFWCWPLLWFLTVNYVPVWKCETSWLQVLVALIGFGMVVDFFYYYGLKAGDGAREQKLSAIWLIPFLLVVLRHHVIRGPEMVLPVYGETLVWTNSLWFPDTYFFMDPKTSSVGQSEKAYEDPNFSNAVFSPFSGELTEVREDGMLVVRSQDGGTEVAIGPVIQGSVSLSPGSQVTENQPLGLSDKSTGPIPGLRLHILKGGTPQFKDVYTGRHMGRLYERALMKRNQIAVSNSKGRFKLRPAE